MEVGASRQPHVPPTGVSGIDRRLTDGGEALADVRTAVRRTLAARTNDGHLIDDLTQETLLRIAHTDRALTDDERRAYAVVTARNLLVSHHRRRSVQDRHLHELVDHGSGPDPEQRTIDNEEASALNTALARVSPDERDLLVRHEVSGTDLATLAGEAGVSRGAIAMRLARARANLRLEFLLVFRRLTLPTEQCRPVLLALTVGDARRQVQLGADEHVGACPTCSDLVGPMTERDRRAAAWLLVPFDAVARRLRRLLRPWAARAVAFVTVLAVVGGFVALARRSPPSDAARRPVTPTTVSASRAVQPAALPSPTVAVSPTPTSAPETTPAAPVLADPTASAAESQTTVADQAAPAATQPATTEAPASCAPALPLDAMDLSSAVGCDFAVTVVTVVAAGGGELSATTGSVAVTIRLVGGSALAPVALPGARVSISGTVLGSTDPSHVVVSVRAADVRLV